MEGLISKKGEFKPKCDKLNMALSQIWDKTKHGLRDWIISHLGLGHLRWRRRSNFGACSPFIQVSLWFKQGEGRKKKRKNRRNQGLELSYLLVWIL